MEFVVLHELGHIVNNHSVSNLIFYGLKTTFISLVAEVFKVPAGVIENIIGFLKFLITFSGQKTIEEQITAEKEIEADRYAVRLQGKKEPALSVLTKITNGNIDLPTHVTVDGNFIIPAITARERIKAIEAS